MGIASIKVLKRQAARCAALAEQTQDEDSRDRYLRLEKMYLQFVEADERGTGGAGGHDVKPAA